MRGFCGLRSSHAAWARMSFGRLCGRASRRMSTGRTQMGQMGQNQTTRIWTAGSGPGFHLWVPMFDPHPNGAPLHVHRIQRMILRCPGFLAAAMVLLIGPAVGALLLDFLVMLLGFENLKSPKCFLFQHPCVPHVFSARRNSIPASLCKEAGFQEMKLINLVRSKVVHDAWSLMETWIPFFGLPQSRLKPRVG